MCVCVCVYVCVCVCVCVSCKGVVGSTHVRNAKHYSSNRSKYVNFL